MECGVKRVWSGEFGVGSVGSVGSVGREVQSVECQVYSIEYRGKGSSHDQTIAIESLRFFPSKTMRGF